MNFGGAQTFSPQHPPSQGQGSPALPKVLYRNVIELNNTLALLHNPTDRPPGSDVFSLPLFPLSCCLVVFLTAVTVDSAQCHVALLEIVSSFANRCLIEYR